MWYYRGLKIRLSGIKLAFFSDMASIKNMFYNIKPKFPPIYCIKSQIMVSEMKNARSDRHKEWPRRTRLPVRR